MNSFDQTFPVARVPPRSRFWPVKDQKRRLNDLATRRLAARLIEQVPRLDKPEFYPLVRGYCICCLQIARVNAALEEGDIISAETGEVRSSVDSLRKLLATQSQLAKELGLTPSTSQDFTKRANTLDLRDFRRTTAKDETAAGVETVIEASDDNDD
jgi:hypothetical protein